MNDGRVIKSTECAYTQLPKDSNTINLTYAGKMALEASSKIDVLQQEIKLLNEAIDRRDDCLKKYNEEIQALRDTLPEVSYLEILNRARNIIEDLLETTSSPAAITIGENVIKDIDKLFDSSISE